MDPHPSKRETKKRSLDPTQSTPELRLFVELYGSMKSGDEGASRPAAPEAPDEVRKAETLPVNRLVRYTRTEPLGEGGMSEVWKAWDHGLSRWVALKFLKRAATVMRHQSALLKLAKMDSSGQDFLRQLTEASSRALEVARVGVWLFDESHTRLVCRDLYSRITDAHESGAVLESRQFSRYFSSQESSRVVAAADARKDPRTSEFADPYLIPLGITSMMDVPIRIRGKRVGVVCHEPTGRRRPWTLEEQQFASSIADQMALSLEASERRRAEEELSRLKGGSRGNISEISAIPLMMNPRATESTERTLEDFLGALRVSVVNCGFATAS